MQQWYWTGCFDMKIGLSFSRCLADIADGRVAMEDILVIIARTKFDPREDEQWTGIWQGYRQGSAGWNINPEWIDYPESDETRFRQIAIDLYEGGKLHQPRQFGTRPRRLPYYWLEAVLPDSELAQYPAVLDAWHQFKTVAGLSGVHLRQDW